MTKNGKQSAFIWVNNKKDEKNRCSYAVLERDHIPKNGSISYCWEIVFRVDKKIRSPSYQVGHGNKGEIQHC